MMLGKRKRRSVAVDVANGSESGSDEDVREIFRRHFEARFTALPESERKDKKQEVMSESGSDPDDSAEEDEEDEWEGLSDGDDDAAVEVVDHSTGPLAAVDEGSKADMRKFMSSKVPSASAATGKPTAPPPTRASPDSDSEMQHLANDRALQKLLRESRLLSDAVGAHGALSSLAPAGRNRHKAHELALRSLGATGSVHEERNMPMAKRKGIESAAREKERKRRKEAGETGVVLEKERKVRVQRQRDRGIGVGVGKFQGGTLKLSQKDVRRITGPSPKERRKR